MVISITSNSAVIQWSLVETQQLLSEVELSVEYGQTERLEAGSTAAVVVGPGNRMASLPLSHLLPHTTYYYRVVASTGVGQDQKSDIETFTTMEVTVGM